MNALILIAALLLQQAAPAQPAGTITGRVTYADGTPYTGNMIVAESVAEPGKPAAMAFTGVTGDFRFTKIPSGRYSIRTGDSAASYPDVVTVTTAPATQSLNFVLPAALTGFHVSGRVIIPPGQRNPPSQSEVEGSFQSNYVYGPIAADGTFELKHVQEGTYSFRVSPSQGLSPVSVLVDRDISGIEFAMPRLFEIAGTVTVEGRASPAGVLLFDGPNQPGALIQPNGSFMTAAIEGEYRVLAARLPADYYIKSLTSGDRDLLTNRLQIVASDKPVQIAVTLAASNGVKVSGNVTGLNGESKFARITLNGNVANNSFDAAINADGSFSLAKVMPGVYTARVSMTPSASSPPTVVAIPNKDVADLTVAIPAPVDVSGRVTVDGNGPPPKFTLYLAHGFGPDWNSAPGDAAFDTLKRNTVASGLQLIQVEVNALSDGGFKFRLPAGDYRVATQRSGIPSPYFLRSVTFAGVNLLTETFTVSDKESSELQVGFGTTSPNPWSSVSGRVVGYDAGTGPFRVALEGDATSAIETTVSPDGTFEFARVLRNSRYTAKVRPENKVASTPRVSVAAKDITNVEIVVPREQEISGRAVVEGGGPVPNFMLTLTAPSSNVSVLVKPDASGAFRIKLPEDERDIDLTALPFGYTLKSLAYGDTNLRACVKGAPPRCSYPKLKIAGATNTELQIRLAVDPAMPFGKISGRVSGLGSDAGDVRLVLSDPSSFNVFEETVGADGSFAFLSLPQGTYVPSLTGSVRSGLLKPSIINVDGVTATGVDIEFPGGSAKREVAASAEASAGARVSEVGLSNRGSANEAAAVATLRTMNTAEVTYLSTSGGKWGTIPQMIEAGLLPGNFASGPVSGFRFGLVRDSENFVVAAIPDTSSTAQNGFYITPDGVVRYSTIEFLAPTGRSGLPVSQ